MEKSGGEEIGGGKKEGRRGKERERVYKFTQKETDREDKDRTRVFIFIRKIS